MAGDTNAAMRVGTSTRYYLLSDHDLAAQDSGGTNVTVTVLGTEYGEVRYKAFGDTRFTSGTSAEYCRATTMRYTGQRVESSIGLYFYGARWYDPALGRFTSPDTVILDQNYPLSWDRFAYTLNNPIKYNDPTGHWPEISVPGIIVIITGIVGFAGSMYDTFERRHDAISTGCEGTLAACFNEQAIKDFEDHEQIDQAEFDGLLEAVYNDLDGKLRTEIDPARAFYDTPFYDGGGDRPDQTVCIDDSCYKQGSINYLAQGMYSAAAGISLEDAIWWTETWNNVVNKHPASEEDIFWTTYGYNYYVEHQEQDEATPE